MEFGKIANLLLRADVDASNTRLDNPAVRTIAMTGDAWVFPLRVEYERVSRTLDGAREKEADPMGDKRQQRLEDRLEAEAMNGKSDATRLWWCRLIL